MGSEMCIRDSAGLWERFKETFDQQVAVLESAAMDALSEELGPEARERALREAHKLAGSLGTFGMPRGSEIAREVETWFRSAPGTEAADILRLSDAVVGLRQCIEAGPATGPPTLPPPRRPSDRAFSLWTTTLWSSRGCAERRRCGP